MDTLRDIQKQADELSSEDRAGLLSYLIDALSDAPLGPDDAEISQREEQLNSGSVTGLAHGEISARVGR